MDQTDHFTVVFVRENVVYDYDIVTMLYGVRMFTADTFLRKGIFFNILAAFSERAWLE